MDQLSFDRSGHLPIRHTYWQNLTSTAIVEERLAEDKDQLPTPQFIKRPKMPVDEQQLNIHEYSQPFSWVVGHHQPWFTIRLRQRNKVRPREQQKNYPAQ